MADRRNARMRAALAFVVALTAALVAGGVLAREHTVTPALTATTLTSARVAATRPPLPTATMSAPTSIAPAQPTAGAGTPASAASALLPATVPATPARLDWVEVGRWEEREMILTDPFTVHGPWRICWTLPEVGGTFQMMIADETQTNWDFKSAPTGAIAGAFDMGEGGTFSLMFHNETPYTAIVIEPPPGVPASALAPPQCGP